MLGFVMYKVWNKVWSFEAGKTSDGIVSFAAASKILQFLQPQNAYFCIFLCLCGKFYLFHILDYINHDTENSYLI